MEWEIPIAAVNEKDKAFDLLEKALQEKVIRVPGSKVEPEYDGLRSAHRYQEFTETHRLS